MTELGRWRKLYFQAVTQHHQIDRSTTGGMAKCKVLGSIELGRLLYSHLVGVCGTNIGTGFASFEKVHAHGYVAMTCGRYETSQ